MVWPPQHLTGSVYFKEGCQDVGMLESVMVPHKASGVSNQGKCLAPLGLVSECWVTFLDPCHSWSKFPRTLSPRMSWMKMELLTWWFGSGVWHWCYLTTQRSGKFGSGVSMCSSGHHWGRSLWPPRTSSCQAFQEAYILCPAPLWADPEGSWHSVGAALNI